MNFCPSPISCESNSNQLSDMNNNIQYIYDGSHAGYAFVSDKKLSSPIDTGSIQEHCQVTSKFIEGCRATIPLSRGRTLMALDDGRITGPSYSLYTTGSSFNINRDFVYGLKCSFWPLQAKEWIHRERLYAWPSKELISASVSQGCHVVPVGSHNGHLKEFDWRFSFSVTELRLVQSMTENQKLAYSVLKAIIKNEMKQKQVDVFSSYHLKTTFFWFLEKRDWKIWETQSLHANIMELLDFFISFYVEGGLPNYFIRKNNMIDHRSSEEIFSVCVVLREVRSDFTMCLCQYIEANQALPVFFDVPLSQLLKDNSEKFLQVCKYNFLVMALAYILRQLRKGQRAVNESAIDDLVCRLARKASQETNLQNSSPEENTVSSEVPTTTSVLRMIEESINMDKMKVTENSAVILAVFNLFLTFHPTEMDKTGFATNSLEFHKHLTKPVYMECLLWVGRLHEKHCHVIYNFVVKKWIIGPNFHTEDERAQKLMKLLMVILGKPTKQASAVTGSLVRRRIEGERFILLRSLAYYLLNVHRESSYIAFQACAYLMDKPVISEIYGFVNGGSYQPTRLRAVELIFSKAELQAQLSEKEFDRLVKMQHNLTQKGTASLIKESTKLMVSDGPCLIRRSRLPRLDGIKVGHVQPIQLSSNRDPHVVKTISLSPPIFEISDFLSEGECDKLIKLANSHMMHTSDIIKPGATFGNLDHDTTFGHWDRNGDKLIDKHEIFAQLLYLRDMHFTDKDINKMFKQLKIGKIKKGFVHPKEFQGKKIMTYIDQERLKDPKVKGRHSNETWLEMWEDDIMRELNVRKAALTGLPIEVIEGSETPVVIKYGNGGHYHCHYDSHSPDVTQPCCYRSSQDGCRVCRYITIMYFLSDVEAGGQTAFPVADNRTFNNKEWHRQLKSFSNLSAYCSKANILLTPKKGKAVMWYNHVIDKSTGWLAGLDRMSYHGGCDVIKGEKWIMNNWINIMGQDFENIRTWNDPNTKLHIYDSH